MMAGSTAVSTGTELSSTLDSYEEKTTSLDSVWKGDSYTSFNSQASEFVGEYRPIVDQLNNFGNACDNYILYEKERKQKEEFESMRDQLVPDTMNIATYNAELSEMNRSISTLKSKIQEALSAASSPSLEATTLSASVSSTASGESSDASTSTTSTTGQNPDLTYSAKYDNYAFPFANGVSAPVTSSVGYRDAPTSGASTDHQGTDIGVPEGTKVHAIQGGTIEDCGEENAGGFGHWVVIRQDDGKRTIYGHLSSDGVQVGQRVETGDVIAESGSTGVSTGPHLHLQIEDTDGSICDSEEIFEGVWPS